MKLRRAQIHNYRSVLDVDIEISDYTLLVGANNAGKSNLLNALRAFYDEVKWNASDVPQIAGIDGESWIELTYALSPEEFENLPDKYKADAADGLKVRRYFRSGEKDRVKNSQSNLYGYVDGTLDKDLFFGAKNVGQAKLGEVIYIPALSAPEDSTKLSGPSPLREVLNFVLKKVVADNPKYAEILQAFTDLNTEARAEDGFLSTISKPLNTAIEAWNIKLDLSVNAVKPEDISKNLVSFAFLDVSLGNAAFDLARYGHGFQRSVIYELIRLVPTFRDAKANEKKEFSPDFTLILFEEPEAFLHPAQQENMAYHLRLLSKAPNQQILVSTHSGLFAGKAADTISQIVRVCRRDGATKAHQANEAAVSALFADGGALLTALKAFVDDPTIPVDKKKRAIPMVANPPAVAIAEDEERFRFQLWLDGERSSLFFADKVLLVEGASERALFNYLLANDWHDLTSHRVCVIDVLGKYNFHRYMSLLKVFEIPYGIILDDDNDNLHHEAINDLVEQLALVPGAPIVAPPILIPDCLEIELGLPKIPDRADKKPVEILKAVTSGAIGPAKLLALRETFISALALA